MLNGSKQTVVGNFFERVCQGILGGELSCNKDGDLCLWDLDTTVEVKSSGAQSSYGFRLDVEQIKSYEKLTSFPFSSALYALFSYTNRSVKFEGRRCTELSQHITGESVERYLAKNIERCVIVDLSIVQRWNAMLPKSHKSILGHLGTETVDIKCRSLDGFASDRPVDQLRSLDLEPKQFAFLSGDINIKLDGCLQLSFPIAIVLRKELGVSLHKRLNDQGIALKFTTPA